MEVAALRRTLRKGKKLPSLISLDYNSSTHQGAVKEAKRQAQEDISVAAAVLSSSGLSPTHAELYGPKRDILYYKTRRSMEAKFSILRHKHDLLQQQLLLRKRTIEDGLNSEDSDFSPQNEDDVEEEKKNHDFYHTMPNSLASPPFVRPLSSQPKDAVHNLLTDVATLASDGGMRSPTDHRKQSNYRGKKRHTSKRLLGIKRERRHNSLSGPAASALQCTSKVDISSNNICSQNETKNHITSKETTRRNTSTSSNSNVDMGAGKKSNNTNDNSINKRNKIAKVRVKTRRKLSHKVTKGRNRRSRMHSHTKNIVTKQKATIMNLKAFVSRIQYNGKRRGSFPKNEPIYVQQFQKSSNSQRNITDIRQGNLQNALANSIGGRVRLINGVLREEPTYKY